METVNSIKNILPNLTWTEREGGCSIQANYGEHYLIVAVKGHQGSGYAKVIWVLDKRINNEIVMEILGADELVKIAYQYYKSNKEKSQEEFIKLITSNENN